MSGNAGRRGRLIVSSATRDRIISLLDAEREHVAPVIAIDGLTANQAGTAANGKLGTIWAQLWHMTYWQDWCLERLRGGFPDHPEDIMESWSEPPSAESLQGDWAKLCQRFTNGLNEVKRFAREADLDQFLPASSKTTVLGELMTISQHNSYHIGQIVALRRLLDAWPPPNRYAS